MKSNEFVSIATKIAINYKTLYILGAFGVPMNEKNIRLKEVIILPVQKDIK